MAWVRDLVAIFCVIALTNAGPYEDWLESARDPRILQNISPDRRLQVENYYRDYYNSYYRSTGINRAGLVPPPNPNAVVDSAPSPPSFRSRFGSPSIQRRLRDRQARRQSLRNRIRQRLGLPVDPVPPADLPPVVPQPIAPQPVRTLRPATPFRPVPRPAAPPVVQQSRPTIFGQRRILRPAVQQPIAQPGVERANLKVAACCRNNPAIPSQCYNLCNFDNFNRRTLTQAYLRKTCPVEAAEPVIGCASDNQDHSKCCTSAGVRGICLNFCTPGIPSDVGNQYLKCLRDLNTIKNCFRQYQNSTP